MQLFAIETSPVADEVVLADLLAMVGRDDHQGVVQNPSPLQFIKQVAERSVEVSDAVVVRVASQLDLARVARRAGELLPVGQKLEIGG
jgi:hypothetical protein